jgi:hypothetical protein
LTATWPNLHDLQSALFFYGKVEQLLQRKGKAAAAGCSLASQDVCRSRENTYWYVLGKHTSMYCRYHPNGFAKPFSMYCRYHPNGISETIRMVFLKPSGWFWMRTEEAQAGQRKWGRRDVNGRSWCSVNHGAGKAWGWFAILKLMDNAIEHSHQQGSVRQQHPAWLNHNYGETL